MAFIKSEVECRSDKVDMFIHMFMPLRFTYSSGIAVFWVSV